MLTPVTGIAGNRIQIFRSHFWIEIKILFINIDYHFHHFPGISFKTYNEHPNNNQDYQECSSWAHQQKLHFTPNAIL